MNQIFHQTMNIQTFKVTCDKKPFGTVYITRNHNNWTDQKIATLIYGNLGLFGCSDSFDMETSDNSIIENLVRRINQGCKNITHSK